MGQFDHSTYAIDNIFSDQIYQGSIFFLNGLIKYLNRQDFVISSNQSMVRIKSKNCFEKF
jgi:hypothetical protein